MGGGLAGDVDLLTKRNRIRAIWKAAVDRTEFEVSRRRNSRERSKPQLPQEPVRELVVDHKQKGGEWETGALHGKPQA